MIHAFDPHRIRKNGDEHLEGCHKLEIIMRSQTLSSDGHISMESLILSKMNTMSIHRKSDNVTLWLEFRVCHAPVSEAHFHIGAKL